MTRDGPHMYVVLPNSTTKTAYQWHTMVAICMLYCRTTVGYYNSIPMTRDGRHLYAVLPSSTTKTAYQWLTMVPIMYAVLPNSITKTAYQWHAMVPSVWCTAEQHEYNSITMPLDGSHLYFLLPNSITAIAYQWHTIVFICMWYCREALLKQHTNLTR